MLVIYADVPDACSKPRPSQKMAGNSQNPPKVCVFFLRGKCKAKEDCKFQHDFKNIQCRQNCKKDGCKFKHFYEIEEPKNKVLRLKPPPKTIFLQEEPVALRVQDKSVFHSKFVPCGVQNTTTAVLNPLPRENDRFSQFYDLSCRDLLPYALPIPGLTTDLKLHQLQGLTWLLQKESEYCGGILADEMGLGKTFLMIALANISKNGTNLVVCPVSLIKPWCTEIKSRSDNTVIEYSPKLSNNTLQEYRFVIISYEMLSSTYTKRPSFYELHFHRVILDEADKIRNYKTKMANSCYSLQSKFKWAITGTPINNSPLDLYSLVRFLRIKPMMDLEYFQKHLGIDSSTKIINLQSLVRSIVLRRTKELVIDLPPIRFETRILELTKFERMIYDLVVTRVKVARVLRLKQCCNDVYSIDGVFEIGELNDLSRKKLDDMKGDSFEDLFNGLRIVCGRKNDEEMLQEFAKMKLQPPNTISPTPKHILIKRKKDVPSNSISSTYTSTKILELVKICQSRISTGKKVIVFSQFVRMLNRLSTVLTATGISSTLYTGEMSQSDRTCAITDFTNSTSCLLASLKCAAVGLNLTMASTVIMFDQWYNPALEDQAFARVCRFGQTRPVSIIRLVMNNTVEGVILAINERKRRCIQLAVGADGNEKEFDNEIEEYVGQYAKIINM